METKRLYLESSFSLFWKQDCKYKYKYEYKLAWLEGFENLQLQRINFLIIEYFVNVKRKYGREIMKRPLKKYVMSIKRWFRESWGYGLKLLASPIFK